MTWVAKRQVATLIEDIGCEPVDLGELKYARLLEPAAAIVIKFLFAGRDPAHSAQPRSAGVETNRVKKRYLTKALQLMLDLHFELIRTLIGVNGITFAATGREVRLRKYFILVHIREIVRAHVVMFRELTPNIAIERDAPASGPRPHASRRSPEREDF